MDLPSLLAGLAADLRVESDRRGTLAVRPDLATTFLEAGFGPRDQLPALPAAAMGKRPLGELKVEGERYLIRLFQHGGLLRWLTGERFMGPTRPFDEWRLQRRLSACGVLTPEVVAARAVRVAGFGWRLALATRRVVAAVDLGVLLARRRDGQLGDPAWRALLGATGRLIAQLHRVGFEHADLTPRNLLVEESTLAALQPRLWVIDLDGSSLHAELGPQQRRANLERLARHLERMRSEHGATLSRVDRWRFLCAYEPGAPARAHLARDLTQAPPGPLRRLGWSLERRLGRGRSGAERHLGRRQDRS